MSQLKCASSQAFGKRTPVEGFQVLAMGNMTDEAFWHSESRKSRRTGVELELERDRFGKAIGSESEVQPLNRTFCPRSRTRLVVTLKSMHDCAEMDQQALCARLCCC